MTAVKMQLMTYTFAIYSVRSTVVTSCSVTFKTNGGESGRDLKWFVLHFSKIFT